MSQKLKIALVAAFVAVDIALVFFVQRQMSDSSVTSTSAELPPGSTPAATPTPTSSPSPTAKVDVPSTGVAFSAGGTLFKYDGGACDGSAKPALNRSSDNGGTFAQIPLPEGVNAVYGLYPTNRGVFSIVAADSDCKTTRYATSVGGESWEKAPDNFWYVNFDSEKLHSPGGKTDPKCTPLRVAAIDDKTARVACADGTITATKDGGDSWKKSGELEAATAIAFRSGSDGFAFAKTDKCATQSYATTDGGANWKKSACIDLNGIEGLAANDTLLAGLIDGNIYISDDNAASWAKS